MKIKSAMYHSIGLIRAKAHEDGVLLEIHPPEGHTTMPITEADGSLTWAMLAECTVSEREAKVLKRKAPHLFA